MSGLRSWCTLCMSAVLVTALSAKDYLDTSYVDMGSPSLYPRDDQNSTSSHAVWLQEDMYAGERFFDNFTFWDKEDPTHGSVTYVNQSHAKSKGLINMTSDGKVIMKGDDTSWLPLGTYRESVRITSNKTYESGSLFILDIDRAPWGCGVWPAWWTVGDDWPWNGEIDIIEGVHDNEHNQVTWHTGPGCSLANNTTPFTGTSVLVDGKPHLDCNANLPSNPGCGIIQWSRASYGPYFDAQGGGVFAMKWDEVSIAVWSFYRSAIPADITAGNPDPSGWGLPVAQLTQHSCNFTQFFHAQRIVFDITFCGDWAGNTYASTNCPGTCQERLMDPTNFQNASFIINSLLVYRKQLVNAIATKSGAITLQPWLVLPLLGSTLLALSL